jgi:hypothetical protein
MHNKSLWRPVAESVNICGRYRYAILDTALFIISVSTGCKQWESVTPPEYRRREEVF